MNYNKYLPKSLDDYKNIKVIENIKKIDFNQNLIIYGESGYGKTHLKKIMIERYKEDNKFIKIVKLNLDEDLKKTNDSSHHFINLLKIAQKKLFIIDNVSHIEINHQIFIKSILKKYKNIVFLIFLNDISNLIENFHSLFINFKLDNNFFSKNLNSIIIKVKNDIKITKTNLNYINKSSNFYDLKKILTFFILFKDEYSKYFSEYKSIILNNNNKIINKIIKNNLNDNIKYVNQLLEKGYSENNIINFIINSLNDESIDINNRNNIINIILKLELDRINYTYIDLLYIIKELSIVDNKIILMH